MITAILVDDDLRCIEELKGMLESYHTDIRVVDVCNNIKEMEQALHSVQPDIVFLDVELGKGQTGFDLLKKISPVNFDIIFTTAYQQYAIQAIKLSAIDYLLKPIDEIELKEAIEKFRSKKSKDTSARVDSLFSVWINPANQQNKIPLPTVNGYELVTIADIVYFEAVNNQTILIDENKKSINISITLKECEDLLTPCRFFRIHRSYLINLNHVKRYIKGKEGIAVMSNGANLTVSRHIKEKFIERLKVN